MEIIETLDGPSRPGCSLALGAFDGLHRGHMAVINAALACGPELSPAVFTFAQSPSGDRAVLTREDKALLLERAGIERMYRLDFASLRDLEPEEFIEDVLLSRLNARRICCGEDFRFGCGARGNVDMLRRICGDYEAELIVLPPVSDSAGKISSTRIRRAIESGDAALAGRLLGRPLSFSGEVVHGNHIGGSVLGTPTINQALPEGFVLPRFGVYAAWCLVEGELYYGVCNIGLKPTVGSDRVLAETWMPEYSGDLYGRQVRLFLLDFIRPEKKFPSLPELREEIKRNAHTAHEMALRTTLSEAVRALYA